MEAAALLPYLQAAGAVISAIGAISQGNAASDAAKYNAAVAQRNAQMARDQAASDAEQQAREVRMFIGQQRAGYGANGISLEGSPLDVLSDTARRGELQRQLVLYKGEVRAMGYESTAELDRSSASAAQTKGAFGAASALLTGAGRTIAGGLGGSSTGPAIRTYGYGDFLDTSTLA